MAKRRRKKKREASETSRAVEPGVREVLDAKPARVTGRLVLLRAALIVAAGLWVFWPALRGDWLWDDDLLVTDNSQLRTVGGLWSIWFGAPSTDYWPLSWTVLWIEWHLWGNHSLGYHLVSLVLHLGSGFLLWRLFARLGLRGGWLGGLLFVVHPLAVESVAWISEIKNTLSLPLFLLSCNAWLDGEERRRGGYLRSVLYYLAAMLAKTSTVMLPLVLLLYGWWKRGTISGRELKRIVPYFVVAVVLGLITVYFQNRGNETAIIEMGSYFSRLLEAGLALCFYLGKFLLPTGLLPVYPSWKLNSPPLLALGAVVLWAVLGFGLWMERRKWGRHLLFGLGFFVLNLLPVLGFIKMQYQAISPVADHFVYLPMIGLIGLMVAGAGRIGQRLNRSLAAGVVAVVMALLAWESHDHANLFDNEETLWTYALRYNPEASIAHCIVGMCLQKSGRTEEAIQQYREALKLKPDEVHTHDSLGLLLGQTGRINEAMEQFQEVLKLKPDDEPAHADLGLCLQKSGRIEEAIQQYREALRLKPDDIAARNNLASAEALQKSAPPGK